MYRSIFRSSKHLDRGGAKNKKLVFRLPFESFSERANFHLSSCVDCMECWAAGKVSEKPSRVKTVNRVLLIHNTFVKHLLHARNHGMWYNNNPWWKNCNDRMSLGIGDINHIIISNVCWFVYFYICGILMSV